MHVVVTGAAGFIGSHLVEALLSEGHTVTGIDSFTDYYARSDKDANVAPALTNAAFKFLEADLCDAPIEPMLDGADAVVNLAATPGLVLSWEDFDRYLATNVTAVKRLIDAALAVGIGHVVHASTSSVYGANATGDEDALTLPVSPYGVTKLAAEHLLRAYREAFGLPLTILRYFSIYGPRQRPDMAYRRFCERLLRGEPIPVYGDGLQSRSNTYVTDCVTATIAALQRPGEGRIYNIGGGREIALCDAIDIIARHLGVEPVIEYGEARRGDQRRTCADITRATTDLGWVPAVEPEEGLRLQVEWARQRTSHT